MQRCLLQPKRFPLFSYDVIICLRYINMSTLLWMKSNFNDAKKCIDCNKHFLFLYPFILQDVSSAWGMCFVTYCYCQLFRCNCNQYPRTINSIEFINVYFKHKLVIEGRKWSLYICPKYVRTHTFKQFSFQNNFMT